jgi:dipeptidyl aminopeptidase/acylaminoacyl peptidase
VHLSRDERGTLAFYVNDLNITTDDKKQSLVAVVADRMRTMVTISWQWFGSQHILYSITTATGISVLCRLCVSQDKPQKPASIVSNFQSFWALKSNKILLHRNNGQLCVLEVGKDGGSNSLPTKQLAMIDKNWESFSTFVVSDDLALMAYTSRDSTTGVVKLHLKRGSGAWTAVLSSDKHELLGRSHWSAQIITLKFDGAFLYFLDSTSTNTLILRRVTMSSRGVPYFDTVAAHETQDIHQVLFSNAQNFGVLAVAWHATKSSNWKSLNISFAPHLEKIQRSMEGNFDIVGTDEHMSKFLVACKKPDRPSVYYVYDKSSMVCHFLLGTYPIITDCYTSLLSSAEAFSIPTKSGGTMDIYLTIPKGSEKKQLPTVVVVHGGPVDRVYWQFNPFSQFLSSRGYLVLDLNYSGSCGYGRKFLEAGYRKWTDVASIDVETAVAWTIHNGYTDPARIAIVGGSFGGYITLACATKSRGLFACGAVINALTDLKAFIEFHTKNNSQELGYYKALFGDTTNKEELESMAVHSPISHASNLNFPIRASYCQQDKIVPPEQTKAFVKEVNKTLPNKGNVYIADYFYIGEGHTIQQRYNVLHYYFMLEKFLKCYLGGKAERLTLVDSFYYLMYRWSVSIDLRLKRIMNYVQQLLFYKNKPHNK